jgi:hypothetical protein
MEDILTQVRMYELHGSFHFSLWTAAGPPKWDFQSYASGQLLPMTKDCGSNSWNSISAYSGQSALHFFS